MENCHKHFHDKDKLKIEGNQAVIIHGMNDKRLMVCECYVRLDWGPEKQNRNLIHTTKCYEIQDDS